jgi:hypothetical protein
MTVLRNKQFGDKGGMPSNFKWSHSCQTSQKINHSQGKEVVLIHVGYVALKPF